MTSLGQWLDSVGLGQYAGAFEQHAIGWDVLPNLNHSILKDVGVAAAGDRVRILSAIRALRAGTETPPAPGAQAPVIHQIGSGEAERPHHTVPVFALANSPAPFH